MSKNLFETYNVGAHKDIVADTSSAVTKSLVLAPGKGDVKAGSVLYKNASGLWELAASGQLTTGNDLAVALEDAETGAVATGAGTIINALFGGVVVGQNLIFASGTTLTAAIARILRGFGINTNIAINEDGSYPETYGGVPVITITAQPVDVSATAGEITAEDKVSVEANASDGATLTYQWNSNASDSNTGGTAIPGATGASFAIPANTSAGTYYFYCVLTAQNVTAKTDPVTVTIASGAGPT